MQKRRSTCDTQQPSDPQSQQARWCVRASGLSNGSCFAPFSPCAIPFLQNRPSLQSNNHILQDHVCCEIRVPMSEPPPEGCHNVSLHHSHPAGSRCQIHVSPPTSSITSTESPVLLCGQFQATGTFCAASRFLLTTYNPSHSPTVCIGPPGRSSVGQTPRERRPTQPNSASLRASRLHQS